MWVAFKTRQGRSHNYVKRSQQRLAKLPNWFTGKKAHDIERVDITSVLEGIADRGVTIEVNRFQSLISAVLGWGLSEGLLKSNAALGINRRFKEEPRGRVLTDAEVRTFWFGIGKAPASEAAKIAMRLCFVLGQRPKEIAELRLDGLALNALQPTATISRTSSKNRTEHVVPLPKLAVDLLRMAVALVPSSEWVFPSPKGKGPIDPHAFVVALRRARDEGDKLFGMKDVQLYDAKRTIATFLGNHGYPNEFVGLLFNHLTAKSGSITGRHYNHSHYMKQKRDLIELWAGHLEEVLELASVEAATPKGRARRQINR
jgi:integrase